MALLLLTVVVVEIAWLATGSATQLDAPADKVSALREHSWRLVSDGDLGPQGFEGMFDSTYETDATWTFLRNGTLVAGRLWSSGRYDTDWLSGAEQIDWRMENGELVLGASQIHRFEISGNELILSRPDRRQPAVFERVDRPMRWMARVETTRSIAYLPGSAVYLVPLIGLAAAIQIPTRGRLIGGLFGALTCGGTGVVLAVLFGGFGYLFTISHGRIDPAGAGLGIAAIIGVYGFFAAIPVAILRATLIWPTNRDQARIARAAS